MKKARTPRGRCKERSASARVAISDVLESIQDGFYSIDRKWCFTYVNRHSAEYLGMRKEDLLGKNVWEKFPRLLGTQTETFNRRAMEERIAQRYEMRGTLTDKWYHVSVYPTDEGISIYWQDITEQKKAEEELRKSEEISRLYMNSIRDVMYTLDKDYRVTSISPSVERYLGYRPDEVMGKPFHELNILAPEYMEQAFLDIGRIFTGGQTPSIIYEFVARDGTRFFADVSGAPLWVDGTVTGVVSVAKDVTRRVQAEKALKENEEKFRRITENLVDFISEVDVAGIFRYLSPSHRKMFGEDLDTIIGRSIFEYVHPDDLDRLMAIYLEAVRKKTDCEAEFRYRYADGNYRWVRAAGHPLLDDEGNYIGGIVSTSDIHERREAEEALRKYKARLEDLVEERTAELRDVNAILQESEAKYRFLTEKMNDIIWTADLDMNCTYCSPSVEKIFGFSIEERMKQNVQEIMTPESYARVLNTFATEIERERNVGPDPDRIVKLDLELYTREGSTLWMECEISAIRNPAGEIVGIYGVSRDITDRKKAEENLQKSEAKYRFLTEKMNDVIWTADKDLRITYRSPSVERLLGYTIKERRNKHIWDIVTPESYERALSIYTAEVTRDKEEGVDPDRSVRMELEFYHKDGSRVWVETEVSAIRNSSGDITGIYGVSRDITARKHAEEELKKHRDHLDDLVGERTAELTKAYEQLERENAMRKATEHALRSREKDLERERQEVDEVNAALKVLLKERERDKENIREDIISNIKISVLPLLQRLETSVPDGTLKEILATAKSRLNDIASPFIRRISSEYLRLTPNEIKVASLIKEGKTSKEIAEFLNVSLNTIITHRYNIRKKTGLRSKKLNLRAYLYTLE